MQENTHTLNGYWEAVITFNINSSIAFMHFFFFLLSTLAHILELTELFYKHCAFKQ